MNKTNTLLSAGFAMILMMTGCVKQDPPSSLNTLKISKIYDEFTQKVLWEYEYDNEYLIKQDAYDNSGDLWYSQVFSWDSKGRLNKKEEIRSGEVTSYWAYHYRSNGTLKEIEFYWRQNSSMELAEIQDYEFNNQGQCSQIVFKSPEGEIRYKTRNTYTGENRTRMTFLDPQDNELAHLDFEYDDQKNPHRHLGMIHFAYNNMTRSTSPSADENGSIIMEPVNDYRVSTLTQRIEYRYNEAGYPIWIRTIYGSGRQTTRIIEYLEEPY